ncbi:uncharacterized protein LOC106181755 isoform X2 [Lingula anatina]|uniref:Uncharacterized protein LOC106181755 isoform X1 n=1 Tax=Lingula anatina TaxID=7574 RepID=A0A1S3KGC5_LINAN|nr:uncharacterized protein LOC106181755 isoform X1 [Lingula anatina]XP_013421688.1 uncharacterized protein LOC106181755 isoform X2 [Lingula anatina]|eukprot:XP_013421687.1 uncharacterized protein LOC106181755 isoform X1 [Lingula anatina]
MTGSLMFTILVGCAIICVTKVSQVESKGTYSVCPILRCEAISKSCIKEVTPSDLYPDGTLCKKCPVCEVYRYPQYDGCQITPRCVAQPNCLISLPTGYLPKACDQICHLCPVCILTKKI